MNTDTLRRYLEFYQDLGIRTLYRRPAAAAASTMVEVNEALPELPSMAPTGDTLLKIIEDLGDYELSRLHTGRNKIVFGAGNEQAKLVFVGEGPAADEDAQDIPRAGRSGQ